MCCFCTICCELTEVQLFELTHFFQQYAEAQKRNKEAGPLLELVRDFLDPGEMYKAIRNIGVDFFCGVPDSLLKGKTNYYRPQRSCEGSFYTCLSFFSREGGLPQCMLGYTPLWEQTPPRSRHPPRAGTPRSRPPRDQAAPPQQTATAVDGTHPTGMHSC